MRSCHPGASAGAALLEVDQQNRDCRGRDARNACRLAHRSRPRLAELLSDLVRQTRDVAKIQILGQARLLVAPLALDLVLLTLDVAGVARANLDLGTDLCGQPIVDSGPV